jgi:hypothetical protein
LSISADSTKMSMKARSLGKLGHLPTERANGWFIPFGHKRWRRQRAIRRRSKMLDRFPDVQLLCKSYMSLFVSTKMADRVWLICV